MRKVAVVAVIGALALAAALFFSPDAALAAGSGLVPIPFNSSDLTLLGAVGMTVPALLERREGGSAIDEIKKAVDKVMSSFEEFKSTNDDRLKQIEKRGAADPLTEEKLRKIEADLAKGEELNQKLTAAQQEIRKAQLEAEEAKELAEKLETRLNRPGTGGADLRREELKSKVNLWVRSVVAAHTMGVPNLSQEQQKALSDVATEMKALNVSADTAGGYLAPAEYVKEIIKGVTEISPARSIVRVRQTAMKSVQIPVRTGQFAARRVAEQATKTETTGLTYGLKEVQAPEMYALIDISNQMLEDVAFDMEAEIRFEATEQFAVKEGQEVVSGTGVGECEGYLTNADIASTVSGSATTIADSDGQANGLVTLFHAIKTAYARNAVWTLNRTTLGSVRKMKDAQKQYIWMPGLANGVPNTILGQPYVEMPDMPSEGANTYPIAFGDFMRGYTLVDRIVMEMLRDPYTQATSGNVRFIFRRRMGGQVVLAEAIRKLKCST